jgi:hypothetical protein
MEGHKLKVFSKRVPRGTSGPKGDKITECWRKLHIDELHYLYSSSNTRITRMIKSRRLRFVGHAGRVVAKKSAYGEI